MAVEFPLKFTLENGTEVVIKKVDQHHYDFNLTPDEGSPSHFAYNDNETFDTEKEESLDFDQLNALRRFWLEREKEELG